MSINIREFLARQLNDHSESPSGVVQKTYYEWTENHISDAIQLGLSYVYSLLPQEFSDLKEFEVMESSCVIDFCSECSKFIDLVSMSYNDNECIELNKTDSETNSLTSLLFISCSDKDEKDVDDSYDYDIVDGSTCLVKFNKAPPVGSIIKYLCASPPEDVDVLDDAKMYQYHSLIADYALWWLFRTDSESRSNLDRARLHFEGVRDFVVNKLLLEFSLKEDDYNYGRRKVDD